MSVLVPTKLAGAGERRRIGADQGQQPTLQGPLVHLDVVADAEPPDHVEQRLQRDPLGVQDELVPGVQDPDVAEHLALRREERGVAAGAHREPLDVITHLPLKEACAVGAG